MKCRGLFLSNNIVYIPVTDESVSDMMKDVKTHAFYNNMKIKTEQGFFIRQEPLSVEKVIRCEVLERFEKQKKEKVMNEEQQKKAVEIEKRKDERQKRNNDILKDLESCLSIQDIADKYKISRQAVYNVKNKYQNI